MVKILVDNREIEAGEGTSLLQTCLDNEIYIPNLCYLEWLEAPPASCRICFVEIEGEDKPVTSCTVKVKEGMVVRTDTPFVRRLQKTAFRLLLSVHDLDCARCPANKKCELQRIAKFLKIGLKPKPLEGVLGDSDREEDHPYLDYQPNRCILCGKCIHVCRKNHGQSFLTFAKRGLDTVISLYGANDESTLPCGECIACIEICPVRAITLKNNGSPSI